MSRWPDKHSAGTWTAACLVRCGLRAKRRNDWMTPARAEPMARPLCPGSVGKPPSPLPQAAPQNPGTVLHGCDPSLCKLFSTAETCLLWLFWPLCTESRSQHAHFTCCQCSCFISGQVCSRPPGLAEPNGRAALEHLEALSQSFSTRCTFGTGAPPNQ